MSDINEGWMLGNAALFKKSSRCEGGDSCVEVAKVEGGVAMRDSKDPDGPVLLFTAAEWDDFLDGVWAGEFNLS